MKHNDIIIIIIIIIQDSPTVLPISHLRSGAGAGSRGGWPVLAEGGGHVLLPPHHVHLLVGQGHHGHAGGQLLPDIFLVLLRQILYFREERRSDYLETGLPYLLVSLPRIFPCCCLGVVVDVVTRGEQNIRSRHPRVVKLTISQSEHRTWRPSQEAESSCHPPWWRSECPHFPRVLLS